MIYNNMKIEINDEQPLDAVVRELERFGYKIGFYSECPKSIETYSDGEFDMYCFRQPADTTLQQLREMK